MESAADIHHSTSDYRRLIYALLGSLLIHALLLSLAFGGEGLWPDFALPWHERRVEAPDLRVLVLPPRADRAETTPPAVEPPPQETKPAAPASTAKMSSGFEGAISRSTAPAVTAKPEVSAQANAGTPAATHATAPEPLPLARLPADTTPVALRAPPVIAL